MGEEELGRSEDLFMMSTSIVGAINHLDRVFSMNTHAINFRQVTGNHKECTETERQRYINTDK